MTEYLILWYWLVGDSLRSDLQANHGVSENENRESQYHQHQKSHSVSICFFLFWG